MIGALSEVCAGLPDQRKGPRRDGEYSMADIGLSAFSVFFMGSPSFLGASTGAGGRARPVQLPDPVRHDRHPERQLHPPDARRRLAGGIRSAVLQNDRDRGRARAVPAPRWPPVDRAGRDRAFLLAQDPLRALLDPPALRRRHRILSQLSGRHIVAPGHDQVLPLPPEFIAPQDGAEKQDCERNAAKRWLARHGSGGGAPPAGSTWATISSPASRSRRPSISAGGNFILTCKPSSHKTIESKPCD